MSDEPKKSADATAEELIQRANAALETAHNLVEHVDLQSDNVHCDFCNESPVVEVLKIKDFAIPSINARSTSGWAVCEECRRLVAADDVMRLVKRGRASLPPGSRVTRRFAERDLLMLHLGFWKAYKAAMDKTAAELDGVASLIREMQSQGFISKKETASNSAAPWLAAVDGQLEAIRTLQKALSVLDTDTEARRLLTDKRFFTHGTGVVTPGVADSWRNDLVSLQIAETYSFSGDALEAIQIAASRIPQDVQLAPEQIPGTGQGWWWFAPPLPIKTTADSDDVCAILWGYVNPQLPEYDPKTFPTGTPITTVLGEAAVRATLANGETYIGFSVYVRTANSLLSPSTMFRWRANETIDDVVARTALEYEQTYAAGSVQLAAANNGPGLLGLDHTLRVVRALCSVFLASAVWIESEYLEAPKTGHIERHARKRYQKESKSAKPPDNVRVVALRRRHKEAVEGEAAASEGKTRQYSCQWVVDPFWRKQRYGPGNSLTKLVHIDSYPKGPKGMPFRAKGKKVFAVIR